MEPEKTLQEMIGIDLAGFTIQTVFHVYNTNYEGQFNGSIGYFKDETIARAFAGPQKGDNMVKVSPVLALTDGTVGFLMNENRTNSFTYMNDEEEAVRLKHEALASLTSAQRRLLGLALPGDELL